MRTKKENIDWLNQFDNDEIDALTRIASEYVRAKQKHPEWPKDLIHQSAIVSEESGELTQACLQEHYEKGSFYKCLDEAVQVGATALRFMTQR